MINKFDFYVYHLGFLIFVKIAALSGKNNKLSLNSLMQGRQSNSLLVFISLIPMLCIFTFFEFLKGKGSGYALAWIASGDSKNHLITAVELVKIGSLDVSTFYRQPVSSSSLLSLAISYLDQGLGPIDFFEFIEQKRTNHRSCF